jgi:formylglycine-generating enzyme required for sulfatase activity
MMIPITKKLFISYRSSDHRDVDHIAEQLRSLKHEDGEPKYATWQDKYDLKGGKSWWDGIVDAIIDCDMFVFHLSPNYLASVVCMAELDYAKKRNRPIIPIVLNTAYYTDPSTDKPSIALLEDVPKWLGNKQFIFYNEDDFLDRFEDAVTEYESTWPTDIERRRPLNPDPDAKHGTSYEVYSAATEYAQKGAFDNAESLFEVLVQRHDSDFADICIQWLKLLDRYQDLMDAKQKNVPRSVFQRKWKAYVTLFPLDFVDDLYPDSDAGSIIFDPNNLAQERRQPKKKTTIETKPPTPPTAKISKPVAERPAPTTTTKPSSISLMPKPFDWISIPNKDYSIAKYPVTNAQFRKFIDAGGYKADKWWTEEGLKHRKDGKWTKPRYWDNSKWNGDTQPVVGVNWFESVAFCLWLSDVTGEKIMLPTEDQWQFVAQGTDGRNYPWGNKWDNTKCNNNVSGGMFGFLNNKPDGHGERTTPVVAYESVGKSPFGVIDMAGNVWEWCLTDYDNKTNDVESNANKRVLRGGSWYNYNTGYFRADCRFRFVPSYWYNGGGFRISRFN